jgi:hypothetical protein
MLSINANDLKRNGIVGIERAMSDSHDSSLTVNVRGKAKYVILSAEEFNQYREFQLEQAIKEAEECLVNGNYTAIEDIEHYALTLQKEIANDI